MRPFISICISSYERKDKVLRIIHELLQSNGDFEIVITDDCSQDDTVSAIWGIVDSRIRVHCNNINQGARENWYCSLKNGKGIYLLQLLDRDWIDHAKLEEFIEILKKTNPYYGYAGWSIMGEKYDIHNKEKYTVLKKGKEGFLCLAAEPCHPSGFFIRRDLWNEMKKKRYFYEKKYGIYPHSYLFTQASLIGDGIIVRNNLCNFEKCRREPISKSKFYGKEIKKDYWWKPEQRYLQFLLSVNDIWKAELENDIREKAVLRRYEEELESATIGYRYLCMDDVTQSHYGLKTHYINSFILVLWLFLFQSMSYIYLKKKKMWRVSYRYCFAKIAINELKEIIEGNNE